MKDCWVLIFSNFPEDFEFLVPSILVSSKYSRIHLTLIVPESWSGRALSLQRNVRDNWSYKVVPDSLFQDLFEEYILRDVPIL